MSDDHSQNSDAPSSKKGFFSLLINQLFHGEPKSRDELLELIRDSNNKELIDQDTRDMLEGVLDIAEQRVRDIMIPRSQMITLKRNQSLEEISKQFNETSNGYQERHSTPLYTADGDIDLGVLGIDTSRPGTPDLRIRDGRPEIDFSNTRRHGPNVESERSLSIGVRDGKPSFRYMYELRF